MATADPLLALRAALSSNSTIELLAVPPGQSPHTGTQVFAFPLATHFSLPAPAGSGRLYFPKDTPTRYHRLNNGGAYDLQTLLFAFLNSEEMPGVYMRKANEGGLGTVSITERRTVTEWLAGKSAIEGPEGVIAPLASDTASGAPTAEAGSSATKRPTPTEPSVQTDPAPAGKKQRYVPNKADQENVKALMALVDGPQYGVGAGTEMRGDKTGGVHRNRETVLRGERYNNFESARTLAASRLNLSREEAKRSLPGGAVSSAGPVAALKPAKKKPQHPIIIVSPSSTALISMHNVKRFLEDSIFERSEDARAAASGTDANGIPRASVALDFVTVDHARTLSSISNSLGAGSSSDRDKKIRFYVVDGVEALSKFGGLDAWDRVVCVMTTGQEWQFRPYKWSEPKELFHHVKGVFVQWTTDPVNQKVRGWNVTELRVDPTKRHIDKSTVADFWRNLESWMVLHKPQLLP